MRGPKDQEEEDILPVLEELAVYLGTEGDVPIVLEPRTVMHLPVKLKVPDLRRDKAYFLEGTPGLADFGIAAEQGLFPGEMLDEFELRLCNPGDTVVYLPSRLCVAHIHRLVYDKRWDTAE